MALGREGCKEILVVVQIREYECKLNIGRIQWDYLREKKF